jgi:hypothetical protein
LKLPQQPSSTPTFAPFQTTPRHPPPSTSQRIPTTVRNPHLKSTNKKKTKTQVLPKKPPLTFGQKYHFPQKNFLFQTQKLEEEYPSHEEAEQKAGPHQLQYQQDPQDEEKRPNQITTEELDAEFEQYFPLDS